MTDWTRVILPETSNLISILQDWIEFSLNEVKNFWDCDQTSWKRQASMTKLKRGIKIGIFFYGDMRERERERELGRVLGEKFII